MSQTKNQPAGKSDAPPPDLIKPPDIPEWMETVDGFIVAGPAVSREAMKDMIGAKAEADKAAAVIAAQAARARDAEEEGKEAAEKASEKIISEGEKLLVEKEDKEKKLREEMKQEEDKAVKEAVKAVEEKAEKDAVSKSGKK
jgi:hypothetical protein